MNIRNSIFLTLLLFTCTIRAQTSPQQSENIASFCKIWGFLKYYHPIIAKGGSDWDEEFLKRVFEVSALQSKQEINTYYSQWITSLGAIKKCKKCKTEIPDSLKRNLDLAWMRDTTVFTKQVINQLDYILHNRNQGKNYYVQQHPFIGNTSYGNEKPYKDSIFPSSQLRLLSLSRYWNIITYFFPYKYLIESNWNTALVEMVPKFRDAKDTIAYNLAMLELIVKINDSHANFSSKYTMQYFGYKWAPFRYTIIDNKAIVLGFYNDSLCKLNDIQYGDVFLTVGNKTIADIIQEKSKYIAGSNMPTKLRNFYYALFSGVSDTVSVSYERNGTVMHKVIYRYSYKTFNFKRPESNATDTFKILEGNIAYLNLGLLEAKHTEAYLNKLRSNKAIIFDVRNYPRGTMYQIARFLNTDKKPFAKFTFPSISYPGIYDYTANYYCGKRNKSAYKGKVILLFDENSQSHAEFTLMALQTAPNVTGIGSQTAGADGNVSLITLPGNYKTYMTGIGVYYPDGRETQRIGIKPDFEVKPSIAGLKSRRDEVLERAIELINSN